ncbi:MAG: metallophosphoesterase [Erysipelotrichaceae bacterium]
MRILKQILLVLVVVALVLLGFVGYGKSFALTHPRMSYKSLSSSKVDDSLAGMEIAYISDLYFGEFYDRTRLARMVEQLNDASVDIILFGGDLFASGFVPSEDDMAFVQNAFKQLKAPYGKFAVLGEQEEGDQAALVTTLLRNSNFEILQNETRRLYYKGKGYIELHGIHSATLSESKASELVEASTPAAVQLAMMHNPISFELFPLKTLDLALAGHTLGGQVYIPILSLFDETWDGIKYWRGKNQNNGTIIHVSNGLGTMKEDFRFMTPSEIIIYTLKKH